MAKKNTKGDDRMVAVEEALGRSEQFIEKNQNILMYAIIGIVVIVLGYFGYQKFVVAPKEAAAQEQIYMAQKYFDIDSLSRALYGDGNALGFLDIADDYGSTDTGNLANTNHDSTRVTWLGHSTFLVQMDGLNILIDPMIGEYASPFKIKRGKRHFQFLLILIGLRLLISLFICKFDGISNAYVF